MNFVDIFIILFFISALVRGVELGVVRQLFSTAGLFAGLFAGVFVQGKLIHLMHTPNTKALLSLCVIIAGVACLSGIAELIGNHLKRRLEHSSIPWINSIDRSLGSLVAGISLLLIVWLAAAIFTNVPQGGLQKQVKGSVVIAQLNKNLPSAPGLVTQLGHLIDPNSFPNVFTGLEPNVDTSKPLPSIGDLDAAVQSARTSTVKIEGAGCGGISEGSGFVADNDLVVTNAHVVAGVEQPYIIDGSGRHRAQVVFFDPDLDMAVLRASSLAGKPLKIRSDVAANGSPAAILGYPGGGDFTAMPAIVIDSFKAAGRNIYNQGETIRDIYSLKGTVRPGNSGGPLIDKDGQVIGVIFAQSTTYDQVGYSLTGDSILSRLNGVRTSTALVSTGSCTQ